jgi:hypothetical protein
MDPTIQAANTAAPAAPAQPQYNPQSSVASRIRDVNRRRNILPPRFSTAPTGPNLPPPPGAVPQKIRGRLPNEPYSGRAYENGVPKAPGVMYNLPRGRTPFTKEQTIMNNLMRRNGMPTYEDAITGNRREEWRQIGQQGYQNRLKNLAAPKVDRFAGAQTQAALNRNPFAVKENGFERTYNKLGTAGKIAHTALHPLSGIPMLLASRIRHAGRLGGVAPVYGKR